MQQVSKQLIKGLPRRIALMLLDCGLIVLCYWLAVMLRFDSGDAYRRVEILRAMAPMLLYVLPIYMIVFWFGGLYEIMWEYAGMRDLARLTCFSGLATGIIMLFDLIYHSRPISGAVLIFGAVFNTAAIAGVRFLWRLVLTMRNAKANKPEDNTPLLIVGAGNAGAWADFRYSRVGAQVPHYGNRHRHHHRERRPFERNHQPVQFHPLPRADDQ